MDLLECSKCRNPITSGIADRLGGVCLECLRRFAMTPEGEPAAEDLPLKVGSTFRGYQILQLIARGGMGVVYKARQLDLDRVVALKVLSPDLAREPGFARRFNEEAKALALLSHPNIVQVFDFARTPELYYLVLEFVHGRSLRQLLNETRPGVRESRQILSQVCAALAHAHDQGIIHRDIKPENVLVALDGRVKVADFGLAKILRHDDLGNGSTRTGLVMGTPRYMAPERFDRPDSVDHRCDIYALGVVLYELLTGAVAEGRFGPPSGHPGIPPEFDRIVFKALAQEPDRRYQNVSELRGDLEAAPASPVADSRRRALSFGGVLFLGLLGAGVGWKTLVPDPASSRSAVRVSSWQWRNRISGSTVQGEELVLNPGGEKFAEAVPVDVVLAKRFHLFFRYRYFLNPGNEPWFFLTLQAAPDSGHDRNVIAIFPEAQHTIHFGSRMPGKDDRLRDWQTLPPAAHGPGRWYDVEVDWTDATKHLSVRIGGAEVFHARLESKDALDGAFGFALGGTVKDWRIRDVRVLNDP
jgi:serine/threonine protein kinase